MQATEIRPHALTPEQVANVEKWIAALRSGKYAQGSMRLCVFGNDGIDRYCCMGVACAETGMDYPPHNALMPSDIRAIYGLSDGWGTFSFALGAHNLAELNDTAKATFVQIADFIEEQLRTNSRKLFVTE